VDRLEAIARPPGVADTVLVDDDCGASATRDAKQRPEIAGEPRRPEVEHREVRRSVREPLRELLHLHRSSGSALSGRRDAVVTVEDADPRLGPPRDRQPTPAGRRPKVTTRPRAAQIHPLIRRWPPPASRRTP